MAKSNKAIKNRPQKAWAGLANARLLLRRYRSMRKFPVILVVFLLCGCTDYIGVVDDRLQGKWRTNKDLTLQNIDRKKISPNTLEFLERTLGDTTVHFKEDEFTVQIESQQEAPEYYPYHVISKDEHSVKIEVLGAEVVYSYVGACMYNNNAPYGYVEYLCRD
jgi:hypothetical protein